MSDVPNQATRQDLERAFEDLELAFESLCKDAARYRWLRAQHWSTSHLAVASDPRHSIKLGYFAPSESILDDEIDKYMSLERS